MPLHSAPPANIFGLRCLIPSSIKIFCYHHFCGVLIEIHNQSIDFQSMLTVIVVPRARWGLWSENIDILCGSVHTHDRLCLTNHYILVIRSAALQSRPPDPSNLSLKDCYGQKRWW